MVDQVESPDEDSTQFESEIEDTTQSVETEDMSEASLVCHLYEVYSNRSLSREDRAEALSRLDYGIPPDYIDQYYDIIQDYLIEEDEYFKRCLTRIIQACATRRSEWKELEEVIEKCANSEDDREKKIALELTQASQPSAITVPSSIYSLIDRFAIDSSAGDSLSMVSINTFECLMSSGDQKIIDRLPAFLPIFIKVTEERCDLADLGGAFCAVISLFRALVCDCEQLHGFIEENINVLFAISTKVAVRKEFCKNHWDCFPGTWYSANEIVLCISENFAQQLDVELVHRTLPSILQVISSSGCLSEHGGYFKEPRYYEGYTDLYKYIKPIMTILCNADGESRIVEVASKLLESEEWYYRAVSMVALEFSDWLYEDFPKIAGISTNRLLDENPMVRYCSRQLFDSVMSRLKKIPIHERSLIVERTAVTAMRTLEKGMIERGMGGVNGEEGRVEGGGMEGRGQEIISTLHQIAVDCEDTVTTDAYDAILRVLRSFHTAYSMQDETLRVFLAASLSLIGFKHNEKWTRDFPEIFSMLASFNPIAANSSKEAIDDCFSCQEKKAEVVLRKRCEKDEVREESGCEKCLCRPYWCLSCLSRIFQAKTANLLGTCPCPFCAKPFCLLDVVRISREDVESTKEEMKEE